MQSNDIFIIKQSSATGRELKRTLFINNPITNYDVPDMEHSTNRSEHMAQAQSAIFRL